MKKGYLTTEFWLSTAAVLCGLLYGSGVIAEDGVSGLEKAVAFIAAALASFGYSHSRGAAKAAADPKNEIHKPLG